MMESLRSVFCYDLPMCFCRDDWTEHNLIGTC